MPPSAFVHINIIMLALLICYHGPHTIPDRREESEREIKQSDHQTIPEQRALSVRTLKHTTLLFDTYLHVA